MVDLARVGARVELDDEVLRTVDAVALRLGSSREAVLEDSVRRGLAARNLGEVLAQVRARGDLGEDEASRVAYEEVRAVRAARQRGRGLGDAGDDARS